MPKKYKNICDSEKRKKNWQDFLAIFWKADWQNWQKKATEKTICSCFVIEIVSDFPTIFFDRNGF